MSRIDQGSLGGRLHDAARGAGNDLPRPGARLVSTVLVLAIAFASADAGAVVGGAPIDAAAFPAAGALWAPSPGGPPELVCTAALVGPRVALTAAHCLSDASAHPPYFTLSSDVATATLADSVRVHAIYVHPDFNPSGTAPLHDIALVSLDAPVGGIAPDVLLDPAESTPVLVAGAVVNLVGYGATAPLAPAGLKNGAPSPIASVGPDEMTIGGPGDAQDCVGDSGGPAYLSMPDGTRRLAGVVSRSANPATTCVDGAIHTRVDSHLAWLSATMEVASRDGDAPDGCAVAPAGHQPARQGLPAAILALAVVAALRRGRRMGNYGGVVRFQGGIAGGTNAIIGTLAAAYRPAAQIRLSAVANGPVPATIVIDTTGVIAVEGVPLNVGAQYLSLDGLSYGL